MSTKLPDISQLQKKELPTLSTLKKKDDTGDGLPDVQELESEALSTSIDNDFIKQQLDLQEPAFSTAIIKKTAPKDIPEAKPLSMETFEDIVADVQVEKQEKIQAEEDKALFKEFDEARTKLKKSAKQEELRASEKADDKGIFKAAPKELREKFESGELTQTDFSPDGNYFYGYLKNVNRSTASFFRKINGAEKLVAKGLNKATGGTFPESEGVLGQVADWVDKKAVGGITEVPNDVVGGVVSQLGQMNMFPIELVLTPQAKLKALSTVTGGAINSIPKLPILLGVGGGLEEYAVTEDVERSVARGVQGFSDGVFLTMLGGVAGKTGVVSARNPLNQQLISTGINAVGFGGKSAFEQKTTTGKIDPIEVASQATFAAVLSVPEIAKMTDVYFTSSKRSIRSVNNMKLDYKELSKEYDKLITEENKKGTSPERKSEIKIAKQGIQNVVSMKFAIQDVESNPDKYREIVERDKTLNEAEKKFQLDKIDEIERLQKETAKEELAKEKEPRYTIEGKEFETKEEFIKEVEKIEVKDKSPDIEVKNDEATTKEVADILESKIKATEKPVEALKEDKAEIAPKAEKVAQIEEKQPKKEIKDGVQEIETKAKAEAEEVEVPKVTEEPIDKKIEAGKIEPKKYKTAEEFKKDFLSDDINLENIDVPLKMKDKISAAKNLREGKETEQGKILGEYLDKSFDKGTLDLITPDKKTRVGAKIEEIAKPEEKELTPTEKDFYEEYKIEAPKKEGAKPDKYQSLGERGSSDQEGISINIGIDETNNIDVTKSTAKKEKNRAVKEQAKTLDKQDLSTIKTDIKGKIIERRKALNLGTFETNLYTHDLQKKFPKEQREAMTFLLEKQGIPEKLVGSEVQKAHDNPTPEMEQAVKEVRDRYNKAWEYITENTDKMSTEQVKDYVTHIWKIPDKKVNDVVTWFTTNNRFTKKRSIESIKEGIDKFGLEPQTTDISEILRVYESARINAIENKKFVEELKTMDMAGVKVLLKGDEAPSDWVEIKHPALTYKTFIPSKEAGKPATLHKSYYKVNPAVKRSLEAVLESGTIDNVTLEKIAKGYEGVSGFMKKVNLSVSLFHHQALTETAIAQTGLSKTLKTLGKDLLWDGLTGKGKPAFKNPEITRDAIEHTVQLGATADVPVADIAKGLDKLAEKAKGVPVAEQLAKGLAKGNERWDNMLWDYLHDGLKIYGYESLAGNVRNRALKEGWTNEQTNKALDEVGQLVNDTYGGQNWDILGVSPKQLRVMRWTLLSPDWTLSTVRQALSPIGVGSLYRNDKFWKEAFTKGTPANTRAKAGRNFWIKAAYYTTIGINLLNVTNRLADEKENPEQYPNRDKPLKDKVIDYSMWGNTIGHNTHLFAGRYDDGSEKYLRWGKQFRELPELFMDEEGVSFPRPAIKKIGGKANPLLNLGFQLTSGSTVGGYENWDLKDKKGWDWTLGALKVTGKSAFPYSTATAFRDDKEWSPTDLFMPASKGMTPSKAIDLFQKGLDFEDGFNYDEEYIQEIYEGAIANNLDALSLFKIAASNKEAEATRALKRNKETTKEIQDKIKETDNLAQKAKLQKELGKVIERKIKLTQARRNFIQVDGYLTKKEVEYRKIK